LPCTGAGLTTTCGLHWPRADIAPFASLRRQRAVTPLSLHRLSLARVTAASVTATDGPAEDEVVEPSAHRRLYLLDARGGRHFLGLTRDVESSCNPRPQPQLGASFEPDADDEHAHCFGSCHGHRGIVRRGASPDHHPCITGREDRRSAWTAVDRVACRASPRRGGSGARRRRDYPPPRTP